jgi:hypothetical protein
MLRRGKRDDGVCSPRHIHWQFFSPDLKVQINNADKKESHFEIILKTRCIALCSSLPTLTVQRSLRLCQSKSSSRRTARNSFGSIRAFLAMPKAVILATFVKAHFPFAQDLAAVLRMACLSSTRHRRESHNSTVPPRLFIGPLAHKKSDCNSISPKHWNGFGV